MVTFTFILDSPEADEAQQISIKCYESSDGVSGWTEIEEVLIAGLPESGGVVTYVSNVADELRYHALSPVTASGVESPFSELTVLEPVGFVEDPTTPIDTFLPYVLPEVQDLPTQLVRQKIIQAARKLCKDGLVWDVELDEIAPIALVSEYKLPLPQHSELVSAYAARRGVRDLKPLDKFHTAGDKISNTFAVTRNEYVEFYPAPQDVTGDGYYVSAYLMPRLASETLPDDITDRYLEVIADGAKGYCLSLPGGDPNMAAYYLRKFDADVAKARVDSYAGHTGKASRVLFAGGQF